MCRGLAFQLHHDVNWLEKWQYLAQESESKLERKFDQSQIDRLDTWIEADLQEIAAESLEFGDILNEELAQDA